MYIFLFVKTEEAHCLCGGIKPFCSKACYFAGRYNRKRGITGADIKLIKKAGDIK